MPNICCRCNTSGRCKNYSCKKSGRECSGCLPYRHGLCTNPKSPHAISSLSLDTTACSSLQSTNDTQSATNPTSFSNFCQAAATVTPAKSSELPTRAADVTIDHAAQPELLSDTIPITALSRVGSQSSNNSLGFSPVNASTGGALQLYARKKVIHHEINDWIAPR